MNDNGKIDTDIYKYVYKQVYDDIEKHYGLRGFNMWEDGDGMYLAAAVWEFWKEEGVYTILNPYYCPETNLIEDVCCANVVKLYIKRYGHWSIADLQRLAEEGWQTVNTKAIA